MSSLSTWNRLEMQMRVPTIDPGLEARLYDPMWMLARQLQFGEFQAQDAGSPIAVQAELNVAPISRYAPHVGPGASVLPGRAFDAQTQPLEPLVEGEPVHLHTSPTPRVGAETGLRLLRMLRAAGLDAYDAAFTAAFPFRPALDADTVDAAAARYLRLMSGRVPDGRAAYALFAPQADRPAGEWTWPDPISVEGDDAEALRASVVAWTAWVEGHFTEPAPASSDGAPGQSAWDPQRQEYRFAIAAHDGTDEHVYVAPEYTSGHLDWDAFHATDALSLGASDADPGPRRTTDVQAAVPGQLAFPGMPASRWWEMEDARVDFGGMEAGRTDLVRMLFVDYAVSYSNDWFLMPVEVPFGTLTRVRQLVVTDTFGVQTAIPPVRAAADGDGWTMFTATGDDEGLLLPPVLSHVVESAPVEDVRFVRDEMANLAWAVEHQVESDAGGALDRHEASRVDRIAPPPSSGDGALRYRLATTVPAHWVPLLPVRRDDTLLLERGQMLPDADAGGQVPTRILGRVLEPEREALHLYDEEVPRSGLRVTRSYQYARGPDGSHHLWVGRRVTPARSGEARSGLRFDVAETI